MKREKKKRKLKSWPIVALFFIVTVGILFYCVVDIKNSLKGQKGANEVQVVNEIKEYNYQLEDTDCKYYKSVFKELQKELAKETVDEEAYASLISKLFVADFYSLKSAVNKNDVGGRQFVYSDYQETFLKLAKDSVYKYVENNIYGKREQDLPLVTDVEVTDVKESTYKSNGGVKDDSAYDVSLKLTYEEDLGYPTIVNLALIHEDKKLSVASMK